MRAKEGIMKNKKILAAILSVVASVVMMLSMVGCGSSAPVTESENASEQEETSAEVAPEAETTEEVTSEATIEETASEENTANEKENSQALPAYEYPGPEAFYYELYKYMVEEIGSKFTDYEVCIPNPMILEVDESDKSDIKVYGDFWVDNYNLDGETLMSVSGGSYPGIIHIKLSEAGYEVTGMDVVADGSDYMESAKELFGDKYDDFAKLTSDQDAREANRAQIVANYVAANGLNITQYQDYGWDPVELFDD